MEVLKKGSVESLLVPLRDRLNNVSNLATVSNLLFSTNKKSDDSACETDVPVVVDVDYPMTAICEIDTTVAAYDPGEEYKLYVKYTVGSEAPILGPLYFRVEDD
jgi:hypothetical protein